MLITVFGVLLSFLSPLGEGAERSDDGEGYYDVLTHSSIFYLFFS